MKERPKGKTDIMKYDRRRARECHRDEVIQLGFRTMVFDSVEIFVHARRRHIRRVKRVNIDSSAVELFYTGYRIRAQRVTHATHVRRVKLLRL